MSETHRLIPAGSGMDALTGEEWQRFECPRCRLLEEIRESGVRILRPGEHDPTAEDAARYAALARTFAGRLQLAAELRRIPAHVWTAPGIGVVPSVVR